MAVLANGHLAGVQATPQHQYVWHWVQDLPASTYLYSVVAGPFTRLSDNWRGRPVDYWTYADTVNSAWRTFGETPTMIEVYSQVLGVPFPWDKYDQSIIPDFTYGGMENVSATTQTDLALHGPGGEPEQSGRGLNAHELAHQWFGDLTTTADWSDIWLNEGITTYMESVENEKTRGWNEAALEWGDQQRFAMGADQNEMRPAFFFCGPKKIVALSAADAGVSWMRMPAFASCAMITSWRCIDARSDQPTIGISIPLGWPASARSLRARSGS